MLLAQQAGKFFLLIMYKTQVTYPYLERMCIDGIAHLRWRENIDILAFLKKKNKVVGNCSL